MSLAVVAKQFLHNLLQGHRFLVCLAIILRDKVDVDCIVMESSLNDDVDTDEDDFDFVV